jgi:integrase
MARRRRGEGSVFKEPGRQWAIRWYEGGRQRYRGGFDSKALAERVLVRIRGELAIRRSGLPADPRAVPPLGELAPDWLERRKKTHAAGAEDASRWNKHLEPAFGRLRPDQVDTAAIRSFVESRRGLIKPGTTRVVVAILSSLYEDLLERGLVTSNPCRRLPKSILRQMRSDHDPTTTPFVERWGDVRRIFLTLPEPLSVAFAIGAMGGLRTGEVFALRWPSVDIEGKRILVSESVKGLTKDRESRPVPLQDDLAPVLKAWRLKTGGRGLVIPPMRSDGEHVDKSTPAQHLRQVLIDLDLPPLEPKPWYQATRHTFASHWAMAGRDLRELQKILGHASITDTERYAHLSPGYWREGAHQALRLDLTPAGDRPPAQIKQPSPSAAVLAKRKHRK